MTVDNEEMDALQRRLCDWWTARGKQHQAAGFDALNDMRDAATVITALRARVAELDEMFVTRCKLSDELGQRLFDAESQLQQVKADAERLVEALEYWMPDESLVRIGEEELAWDRHIKLIQTVTARRNDG